MRRSLIHFWPVHLAVIAGAAVATAVLTGSLVVGDSIQASLRDLTLERLGRIEQAVTGERLFAAALADRLGEATGSTAVPILALRGTAVQADSGARAARVGIWGVDGVSPSCSRATRRRRGARARPTPGADLPVAGDQHRPGARAGSGDGRRGADPVRASERGAAGNAAGRQRPHRRPALAALDGHPGAAGPWPGQILSGRQPDRAAERLCRAGSAPAPARARWRGERGSVGRRPAERETRMRRRPR